MARKSRRDGEVYDDVEDESPERGGDGDGEDESWEEGSAKGGKKKLFIFIGAFALVACGAAASAYFTGVLDPILRATGAFDEGEELKFSFASSKPGYFELPELLVNLSGAGNRSQFLKLRLGLELRHASEIKYVESLMPRVMDRFQVYLRELRIDDIHSARGLHRLRGELLVRVNEVTAPAQVNDVLFKEVLVQ